MKNDNRNSESQTLRQKAEALLKMKPLQADSSLSAIETAKLIHELKVHQIELELQNKELILARFNEQKIAEKYTELYDLAPSGYFTLDNTGEILECNLCGSQMFGHERSQLKSRRFALFVSVDTRSIFSLFLDKVFQTKSKETCEVKLISKGDGPTYVLLTGVSTENQKQCNITMVDITLGKQLEEKLLFINKAVESAGDAIGISDARGRHIYQNKALSDLFGYATAEELQAAGGGAKAVNDPRVAKELFDSIMSGKPWSGELEMVTKSGHIFTAYERADAITNSEGNIIGLIGVIQDITGRKQAEQALIKAKEQAEESRNRFQSIFFGAPTGIGVVKDRVITEVNPKLLEITGYDQGDLIGQSALLLYPSKEEFEYVGKEKYRQIKETGTGTVEIKWRKKDGTIIDVLLSSNVIFPGDYTKGVTFTASDISSRKLSESMFRDIVEKNPLSIQILNLDGYTIQTNSAHTRIFGAVPPADYSIFKDTHLLQQGFGKLFEQIKNGEIVHFPDSYFNAHDVDPSFPDALAWIKATGFTLNDSNGVPD